MSALDPTSFTSTHFYLQVFLF